jgi:4-hydroxy-tetrahydrodipicolinate synthase
MKVAVELAHLSEDLDAAAIQLLAPQRPFAGPPTTEDLVAFFEAVARETRLPITLYLNPGPGADVSIPDTIALAKLPQVLFIKESSRDLARVSRLIVEIDRTGLARYFTTMQMLLITLLLGGSGATMPPPAAEIARHIIDAFADGDYAGAAQLQLQFALFPSKWMHRGLAPVMKAAMNLIGVPAGAPYPPYSPLRPEELDALSYFLKTSVLMPRLLVEAVEYQAPSPIVFLDEQDAAAVRVLCPLLPQPLNLLLRGNPFGASRPASARLPRQSASSLKLSE